MCRFFNAAIMPTSAAFRRLAPLFTASYLCSSAASVFELCSLPSQDSDRSYGLSRTLVWRNRVAKEDDAEESGFSDCGEFCGRCCGDVYGDAPPACVVIGDVVVGSLRRVESRLMNDVLCLLRWHEDVLAPRHTPLSRKHHRYSISSSSSSSSSSS